MRAAHVIKGAAANLMCQQLRQASMLLESAAHDAASTAGMPTPEQQAAVQQHYGEMQLAGSNFLAYLQSIGV
jgi:HPt (histidine-containing phosphotransfer) domain-containing protein